MEEFNLGFAISVGSFCGILANPKSKIWSLGRYQQKLNFFDLRSPDLAQNLTQTLNPKSTPKSKIPN